MHFFIHNSFQAADVIFTRPLIEAIRISFPGVSITLETTQNNAYLWKDLGLPISIYQGVEYQNTASTPNCPSDAVFVNICFGMFQDILTTYGITYENRVHTFNRQMYQYKLQNQYQLVIPQKTPMIKFYYAEQVSGFRENGILLEGNEYLPQLVQDFPNFIFYCSVKPEIQLPNVVDCSAFNLVQLSMIGNRCEGLIVKDGAVNAATMTETNRCKPRCIISGESGVKFWDNYENPIVYANNHAELKTFLLVVAQRISSAESFQQINFNSIEKILIVSHKQKQCGVYQFGLNIANALKKSTKYSFAYAECSNPEEFFAYVNKVNPSAIIYNFHPATMAWLTREILDRIKVPNISVIHEVTQALADSIKNNPFQYYTAPDPTLIPNNPIVFKTGRLILPYVNKYPLPQIPTIGSFGFGLSGKGFEKVIHTVQQEYDQAHIRFHIPFATFGDADGSKAIAIAQRCQSLLVKPGIRLSLSHEFLTEEQLLDFLAQNTVNAFFYDNHEGRGISSTIDYALAVQRPIAITKSTMFRHLFSANPSICIEDSSLKQIINNGITPLMPFYTEWSEANLVKEYERIMDKVLNKHYSERSVELFQTAIGNYYLPTDVPTDIIVNEMKAGRIFEPEILDIAKQYIVKGTTVLDIGGNFGQMSLFFSQFVGEKGHVFSFEADDFIGSVLKKNIAANHCYNITPICKAVYDKDGEMKVYPVQDFKRFGSYGSYGIDPNAKEGRKVETITIDSLNIQNPISFMKVDIQGSDLFALRGSVNTIKRHKMPILFEFEEQFQQEFNTSWDDYLKFIDEIGYKIEKVINGINYLIIPIKKDTDADTSFPLFNRILDDSARLQYKSVIDKLFELVPDMMARKIPEANIQQAFVFDTVQKFASRLKTTPKMLCVGSFDDTAAASLKKLGYQIEEIDPAINCDLNVFFHKPTTIKNSYDIIFSTSVIEHVRNDELFISQIAELLAPGGTAILTCDFNDQYKRGDRIPHEDFILYTQKDFKERFIPLLKNCSLVDTPNWDCPNPDFMYAGCRYTFATFVFQKNPEHGSQDSFDRELSACYNEILGRHPDADEHIHWKTIKVGIDTVRNALLTSYEYQQKRFYERRQLVHLQRFKIYVMVDDLDVGLQIIRGNSYEPHVTQALISILKSGDVFVDIGANIGFLTLLAASIVQHSGKVISFEPNIQNLQLIYASILENNFENIRVYPFAVSDSQQIMKIKHFCSNGFLESPTTDQKNIQLVQTVKLDDLLQTEQQINVVKMDIEGYEPSALRGMDNLIRKHRPIILTEFSPWHIQHRSNMDPHEYLKQIEMFNYRLSIIETSGNNLANLDADSVMRVWKNLNNDKMQLDIVAHPL